MCGILGYRLLRKGHEAEAVELFEQLLLQSQIRGKHATGVSFAYDNKVYTYKQSMPAKAFVKTGRWEQITKLAPSAMIGHCRYSTSGTPAKNANNQPIAVDNLAIVHNGLVSMGTKEEFEAAYNVECNTSNDSEIILQSVHNALDEAYEYGADYTIVDGIAEALAAIHRVDPPIFACGFLDSKGNVTVVRDHIRPLWLFYVQEWSMLGFCSTGDIWRRAHKHLDHNYPDAARGTVAWPAEPYSVYPLTKNYDTESVKLPFTCPKEHRFERPNLVDKGLMHIRSLDNRLDNPDFPQGDHRDNPRESFKRYSAAAIASWEIDPNYPLMNYLFQRYELSKSQEFWACYLYGVFYHPGSVFYVMQEFPEFEKVDLGRLKRWHDKNWRELRYNTDRKYEKGHFVEMFESYRDLIGKQTPTAQEEFFNKLLDQDDPDLNYKADPVKSFHNVEKALRKLLRFGRYSVYIYTECLHRCMGMPIHADTVFLKESKSPRAGLCYAINRPDWAKAQLSQEQWKVLEGQVDALLSELREEYPTLNVDHWFLESCLCSYKGFFRPKKGRYIPYYIDRMADEILQMQQSIITTGVDWKVLWQFRRECLMREMLGEYCDPPRLKVHKPWEHVLMNTGRMIGLWPLIKREVISAAPIRKARGATA